VIWVGFVSQGTARGLWQGLVFPVHFRCLAECLKRRHDQASGVEFPILRLSPRSGKSVFTRAQGLLVRLLFTRHRLFSVDWICRADNTQTRAFVELDHSLHNGAPILRRGGADIDVGPW